MKRFLDDPSDYDETTLDSSYNSDSSGLSNGISCHLTACNLIGVRRKKPTPSEGERAVVDNLNELSAEQREEVFEEIHGIRNTNTIPESPDFIEAKMKDLRRQMSRKTRAEQGPYELASLMSPGYVNDRDFLLLFLRADMFDTKKAANRMVLHFKYKKELFGASKLVKQITWDDLDETDKFVANTCSSMQYPELKDNAGRKVWVAALAHRKDRTEDNVPIPYEHQLRYTWYTCMGLVEGNEHAQKHGIVGVGYMVGLQNEHYRSGSTGDAVKLIMAMPYRYAGLHVCYDNPKLKATLSLVQLYSNYQTRVRFRIHFGTHMECQYSLMAFGLSQSTFPLDEAGNLKTEKYLAHLERRQQEEAEMDAEKELRYNESGLIEYPTFNDVLFGRGKSFNEFEGNKRMYTFIDRYKKQYSLATTRDEKTVLSEMVVMMVKERQGQFLKRAPNESDGWVSVSDGVARDKISHTFRTRLK